MSKQRFSKVREIYEARMRKYVGNRMLPTIITWEGLRQQQAVWDVASRNPEAVLEHVNDHEGTLSGWWEGMEEVWTNVMRNKGALHETQFLMAISICAAMAALPAEHELQESGASSLKEMCFTDDEQTEAIEVIVIYAGTHEVLMRLVRETEVGDGAHVEATFEAADTIRKLCECKNMTEETKTRLFGPAWGRWRPACLQVSVLVFGVGSKK